MRGCHGNVQHGSDPAAYFCGVNAGAPDLYCSLGSGHGGMDVCARQGSLCTDLVCPSTKTAKAAWTLSLSIISPCALLTHLQGRLPSRGRDASPAAAEADHRCYSSLSLLQPRSSHRHRCTRDCGGGGCAVLHSRQQVVRRPAVGQLLPHAAQRARERGVCGSRRSRCTRAVCICTCLGNTRGRVCVRARVCVCVCQWLRCAARAQGYCKVASDTGHAPAQADRGRDMTAMVD